MIVSVVTMIFAVVLLAVIEPVLASGLVVPLATLAYPRHMSRR